MGMYAARTTFLVLASLVACCSSGEGEDSKGRALFIFCRSPYAMRDFNKILCSLPIDLVCARHLEAGPEAQLYVKFGDLEMDLVGSYETGLLENDSNQRRSGIPNVTEVKGR